MNVNPLAAEFFLLPSNWHGGNFLHTLTGHGCFFHVYCLALTFTLVLTLPRLKIEAPPLFTVQGKYIYKMFKAENQETQFPLLCTKPHIDKHKFSSFHGWQSRRRFIRHNSRIERADLLPYVAQ